MTTRLSKLYLAALFSTACSLSVAGAELLSTQNGTEVKELHPKLKRADDKKTSTTEYVPSQAIGGGDGAKQNYYGTTESTIVKLVFQYDAYPEETSWVITDLDAQEDVYEGPQYTPGSFEAWTSEFEVNSGQRFSLTVYDSYGDGIFGGYFDIYHESDSGDVYLTGGTGAFTTSTSVEFTVPGGTSGTDDDGGMDDNTSAPGESGTFDCQYDSANNEYLCLYGGGAVSYPLQDPPTILAAACYSAVFDEPTASNCACGVFVGTIDDANNAQQCSTCQFLPSDDESDGVWAISWDCSNLLTGDCVGQDESGNCISNVDSSGGNGNGAGGGGGGSGGSGSGYSNARLCADDTGGDTTGYQICLDLYVDAGDEEVFQSASAVWSGKIVGDVEGVSSSNMDPSFACSSYPEIIDDLYICGKYEDIDGVGAVLGQASYVYARDNNLPIVGVMAFDSADIANLKAEGTLQGVILHEMGHVLGVGTAWDDMGLVGADFDGCPYLGANANREWQSISGCSGSVPIEADGGEGTACSHWDEDCLESEIMTGYLGDTDPIFSRITIATMEDIGYEVDYSQAETYTAANINPLCLCGRRGLRGTEAALGVTEPHRLSRGGNSRRKLTKEGHAAAQAHGRRHLEKMHQIGRTISPSASDKVRYVGDQFVTVFYKEGDHIYGVHVSSGY